MTQVACVYLTDRLGHFRKISLSKQSLAYLIYRRKTANQGKSYTLLNLHSSHVNSTASCNNCTNFSCQRSSSNNLIIILFEFFCWFLTNLNKLESWVEISYKNRQKIIKSWWKSYRMKMSANQEMHVSLRRPKRDCKHRKQKGDKLFVARGRA